MIIAVVGPSAVGKTKLSIMLAKKYNGIIINADATQVYKELNIGSAKVTNEEKDNIPHYLLDIKNPNEDYSVMNYQSNARKILEENQDKNIIVVGGTGLYLKALFYDYIFEEKEKNNYEDLSNEELYKRVLEIDSNAIIHPNNRVRLINYLNSNGNIRKNDKELYDVIYVGLTMDRTLLYERINDRVDSMINDGLINEAKALYEKYPESGILKRAIGYKELIKYFNNELSLEEAIDLIKKNSRHYVKRQYTWFNNQMIINWFNVNVDNFNETYDTVTGFIDSLNSK